MMTFAIIYIVYKIPTCQSRKNGLSNISQAAIDWDRQVSGTAVANSVACYLIQDRNGGDRIYDGAR